MQVLLPPECFQLAVELQSIEKNKYPPSAKTFNSTTSSAVEQQKLYENENSESMTLFKVINKANQKDNLYISIHAHLKDPTKHAKPNSIKLKDCKVSEGLLIKRN